MLEFFKDSIFFINILFAIVVIFFERKRPTYTLFWVTLLLLTSYLGFILYLFFGLTFYKKRQVTKFYSRTLLKNIYHDESYKIKLVEKKTQLTNYIGGTVANKVNYFNNIEFFTNGNPFFQSMIDEIRSAKETINLEYFTFNDDEFGKTIFDELEKKATEGVKIKIIVDGIGTRNLKHKRIKSLEKVGIEIRTFFPSKFPFFKFGNLRANYRDHRKLCIIDSLILYTGGYNIGNEYIGKGKLGPWRDTGARIAGETAVDTDREFYINWGFLKGRTLNIAPIDKILRQKIDIIHDNIEEYSVNPLQIVSNGPNYETRTIRDTYLSMIMSAQKSIYIQTPYFVPDDTLLTALKIALISGIHVKIMIPHIPDHPFVYWANQSFVIDLMGLGAEVYRYQEGFLHSKIVIIDRAVASFGSANFDYRSLYQNFEMNFMVYDVEIVGKLKSLFYNDIKKSKLITKNDILTRKNSEKFKESICRLMSPII